MENTKPTMGPGHLFKSPAIRYGNHTAIVYKDTRLTYAEMDTEINRLSNGLLSLGLTTGHKVAVLLPNSIEAAETLLGVTRAGLCFVALNARHSPREHTDILNDAEANAIVCGEEFTEVLEQFLPSVHGLKHIIVTGSPGQKYISYRDLKNGQSGTPPEVKVDCDKDLARIQYTSGTTGTPKGVVWTFRIFDNIMVNTLINLDQPLSPADINLNCGPLTHAAGLILMIYYCRGAVNVILPAFDEKELLETIDREHISSMLLVPTMFYRLLMFPDLDKYDISSIKRIWYGTAPMSVDRLKQGIKIFGNVFRQNYGMTEIPQPILFLGPEDHIIDGPQKNLKRLSSAGLPALGVEVKIVNEEGRETETDEIGEILIRSDKLMKEYWKNSEATAQSFKGGWFHTRDMAKKDTDGYIYIVDRKSDMIISGGFNIYPREVEEVIMTCPGVKETSVFGIPDDLWGEAVMAVVEPVAGEELTEEDVKQHCSKHLSGYKKPTRVNFINKIPKNNYGKIERKILRSPFWQDSDRNVH